MRSATGKASLIWLLFSSTLAAQWYAPPPLPTGLPGRPFFIRNIWYIGGAGPWDTMTIDPAAGRLYIAHGRVVQVVDVQTGSLAGEITGLSGAYAIALDDRGVDGYISDGPGSRIVVFDRSSLQTIATIPTPPDPRALVYEPQSGLVFVVQIAPPDETAPPDQHRRGESASHQTRVRPPESYITVIDPESDSVLGSIRVSGHLGYAQSDGAGQVYVSYTDRGAILRFNAQSAAADLRNQQKQAPPAETPPNAPGKPLSPRPTANKPPVLDWTGGPASGAGSEDGIREISLGPACGVPHEFALDGHDARLFAACGNMTLEVLNTAVAQPVTTLSIGSGVEEIGYDPIHGYIFAADGAGIGNLTVIRRDSATDTYAIVQNLPTRQRAYVMAVDPENGEVYLVTDIVGADLAQAGGIGSLRIKPVNGSFQVIQIGN